MTIHILETKHGGDPNTHSHKNNHVCLPIPASDRSPKLTPWLYYAYPMNVLGPAKHTNNMVLPLLSTPIMPLANLKSDKSLDWVGALQISMTARELVPITHKITFLMLN